MLRRIPTATVSFVAAEPGPLLTHEPPLTVIANNPLGWFSRPDVLVVPGGFGVDRLLGDRTVLAWVATAARDATAVLGASTGALVLAAAGVLDGRAATTHWLARDRLLAYGARPVDGQTVVRAGRIVTTAGGAA
ncbi:MAG: DJ-1/PfpI family protein, partial [Acidimicrobiales bacterium]